MIIKQVTNFLNCHSSFVKYQWHFGKCSFRYQKSRLFTFAFLLVRFVRSIYIVQNKTNRFLIAFVFYFVFQLSLTNSFATSPLLWSNKIRDTNSLILFGIVRTLTLSTEIASKRIFTIISYSTFHTNIWSIANRIVAVESDLFERSSDKNITLAR